MCSLFNQAGRVGKPYGLQSARHETDRLLKSGMTSLSTVARAAVASNPARRGPTPAGMGELIWCCKFGGPAMPADGSVGETFVCSRGGPVDKFGNPAQTRLRARAILAIPCASEEHAFGFPAQRVITKTKKDSRRLAAFGVKCLWLPQGGLPTCKHSKPAVKTDPFPSTCIEQ